MIIRVALQNANGRNVALGHFNVSVLSGFHAVVRVGRRLRLSLTNARRVSQTDHSPGGRSIRCRDESRCFGPRGWQYARSVAVDGTRRDSRAPRCRTNPAACSPPERSSRCTAVRGLRTGFRGRHPCRSHNLSTSTPNFAWRGGAGSRPASRRPPAMSRRIRSSQAPNGPSRMWLSNVWRHLIPTAARERAAKLERLQRKGAICYPD
jgi:hypothetical protein